VLGCDRRCRFEDRTTFDLALPSWPSIGRSGVEGLESP